MKYVFAMFLVICSLVMVFHIERLIPAPRAFSNWVVEACREFLPFSAKTAYANAAVEESRHEVHHIRKRISKTAIQIEDLRIEIEDLRSRRKMALLKIEEYTKIGNNSDIENELKAFHALDSRLDRLIRLYESHNRALEALDSAEEKVVNRVDALYDRIGQVENDHVLNDALELASVEATDYPDYGPASSITQGERIIAELEFDERVRTDMYERFYERGSLIDDSDHSSVDPTQEARDVLDKHRDLLK